MPRLPEVRYRTPPAGYRERLARWFEAWNEELRLRREEPDYSTPLPLSAARPARRGSGSSHWADESPAEPVKIGQVRLLHPRVTPLARRPVYVAVLSQWGDRLYMVAPFGPFPEPATTSEWLTGREHFPLRVLSLWNVRSTSGRVLTQSWVVTDLSPAELEDAHAVFEHALTGSPLSDRLLQAVGCPIVNPQDPRIVYQREEAELLAGLSASVEAEERSGEGEETGQETRVPAGAGDRGGSGRSTQGLVPDIFPEGSGCKLPGLAEIVAQHEMALAAAEVPPSLAEYIFWTRDRQTMVVFRLEASGKSLSVTVWDAEGEPSNALDGCVLVGSDPQVIVIIADGVATVPAQLFVGSFTIRTSGGAEVPIDVQS